MDRDEILSMEAGRELDALVAAKVLGCTVVDGLGGTALRVWIAETGAESYQPLPHFSTNIMQAWSVLERLYDDGWVVGIGSLAQVPRGWRCELTHMHSDDFYQQPHLIEANAYTASLAICRAALFAKEATNARDG